MKENQIAIYGGGGFARETAWLVESLEKPDGKVVCFIDDDPGQQGKKLNGIPVVSLADAWNQFPEARVLGGIGNPRIREKVITRAAEKGFSFAAAVHPNVIKSSWITMGEGIVICAGCILTTNIQIRDHVQINLDCTIGHDVVLEEFATLAPGVHLSGNVHVKRGAYLGTGANIINGTPEKPLVIHPNAVVGAGACVTRDVPPDTTVVGIPARPIQKKG